MHIGVGGGCMNAKPTNGSRRTFAQEDALKRAEIQEIVGNDSGRDQIHRLPRLMPVIAR